MEVSTATGPCSSSNDSLSHSSSSLRVFTRTLDLCFELENSSRAKPLFHSQRRKQPPLRTCLTHHTRRSAPFLSPLAASCDHSGCSNPIARTSPPDRTNAFSQTALSNLLPAALPQCTQSRSRSSSDRVLTLHVPMDNFWLPVGYGSAEAITKSLAHRKHTAPAKMPHFSPCASLRLVCAMPTNCETMTAV
jgi:hypothetical protein